MSATGHGARLRARIKPLLAASLVSTVAVAGAATPAHALSTSAVKPGWYSAQPIAFTECHPAAEISYHLYAQLCYTRTSRYSTQVTVVLNNQYVGNGWGFNFAPKISQRATSLQSGETTGWMRSSCGAKNLPEVKKVLYCVGTNVSWPQSPLKVSMDGETQGVYNYPDPVPATTDYFYQYLNRYLT